MSYSFKYDRDNLNDAITQANNAKTYTEPVRTNIKKINSLASSVTVSRLNTAALNNIFSELDKVDNIALILTNMEIEALKQSILSGELVTDNILDMLDMYRSRRLTDKQILDISNIVIEKCAGNTAALNKWYDFMLEIGITPTNGFNFVPVYAGKKNDYNTGQDIRVYEIQGFASGLLLEEAAANAFQSVVNQLLAVCPGNFNHNGGYVNRKGYHGAGLAVDLQTNAGMRVNYQNGSDTVLICDNKRTKEVSAYDVFYVTSDVPFENIGTGYGANLTTYVKVDSNIKEQDIPESLQKYLITGGLDNVLEATDVTRSVPNADNVHRTSIEGTYLNLTKMLEDVGFRRIGVQHEDTYPGHEWHHYQYNPEDEIVNTPNIVDPTIPSDTVNLGNNGESSLDFDNGGVVQTPLKEDDLIIEDISQDFI